MSNIKEVTKTIHKETEQHWRWITREQLASDCREFANHIPYPCRGVAGIFRSGGIVACNLATALNVPVYECNRKTGVITQLSNGWRLDGKHFEGKLLLVDDSTYNGGTTGTLESNKSSDCITAALYSTPNSRVKPNLIFREMPRPFFVEWHFFGSGFVPHAFIEAEVLKHWIASPYQVNTIWAADGNFERRGIRYKNIVEGDKVTAFKKSGCKWCVIYDPIEAESMAEVMKYPIICPSVGRVFGQNYRLEMAF